MSIKELAFKVEDMSYDAREVNSMQEVLFQAIFRGEPTPEPYEWAFGAFGKMTESMFEKLEVLREEMFELISDDGITEVDYRAEEG